MSDDPSKREEDAAVQARYARRDAKADAHRYSVFDGAALFATMERQAAILGMLSRHWAKGGVPDLASLHIVDVGCGDGNQLLDWIRWGAQPTHLTGIDLLPHRIEAARARLPGAVKLKAGPALAQDMAPDSQDVVMQSTVFSSILSPEVQAELARTMWSWVRPGGMVLWYDFTVNNPRNPDVRGVPLSRIQALFPQAIIETRRLTLAPPLSRALPGALRPWLNWPLLRTHVLAALKRPEFESTSAK